VDRKRAGDGTMELDRFTELADRLIERIPPIFMEGLNGGVAVRRRSMRRKDDPAGVFILAEYFADPALGNYIQIYWGSFVELFDRQPDSLWEQELWETIRHELRHHVEAQAGMGDLDLEDEIELEAMKAEVEFPDDASPPPRRFTLKRPLPRPDGHGT